MKILHYSLGFPPYRTGGLTKFCIDTMLEQKRIGNDVSLLWPGEIKLFKKNIAIKERQNYQGIKSWELINPLPISYDEGIADVNAFTAPCDKSVFYEFLNKVSPDVIHIHTLMGLYKEFISAARDLGIKTVFSVHDFFSICPKVTMYRRNRVCCCVNDYSECPNCNLTALSLKKIKILQSPLYRVLKDSSISQKLRKKHRDQYLSGEVGKRLESSSIPKASILDYKRIRQYYGQIIEQINLVHYNSMTTKNIFECYFKPKDSRVITISHADIRDNRRKKKFGDTLQLTYLGPQGGGKGFFCLQAALNELWMERKDFHLNVFFTPTEQSPYIKAHGKYTYKNLEMIFDKTDVLIVPSIWYETFGYTVLEALSFGVPVIASGNVGAKDIIPKRGGIIVDNITVHNLKEAIAGLNRDMLNEMNREILLKADIKTIEEMTKEIISECY